MIHALERSDSPDVAIGPDDDDGALVGVNTIGYEASTSNAALHVHVVDKNPVRIRQDCA